MADALGTLSKMGLSNGLASWDTAYAAATSIIPFVNETLTSKFDLLENDSLQGYGARLPGDQGVEWLTGATEHQLNYNASDILIAAVMGLNTAGVITISDSIADFVYKYYAIEFEKQVKRYRFWACKANKFTISGEKDKYCRLVVDWYAKNFDMVDTAFPTLAQPTNVLVPFDDLVFRLADQANALSAGDVMGIESFEIVLDRSYKTDDYESSATTPRQPLEPIQGGWRVCELTIKLPRYAANTIAAWKDANTPLQADLIFTGPSTYTKKIEFPDLRISSGFDQNIGGPGPLTVEGKFTAYRSAAIAGEPYRMYAGNEMRITVT